MAGRAIQAVLRSADAYGGYESEAGCQGNGTYPRNVCNHYAMGDDAQLVPITPPQCEFVPVGIVPFTMPGSDEVADKVVEALGSDGRSVLIKNHGMFCCGKDMKAAMAATVYTEEMATTAYYAKVLGNFEPMPEAGVKKMKELIAADQAV